MLTVSCNHLNENYQSCSNNFSTVCFSEAAFLNLVESCKSLDRDKLVASGSLAFWKTVPHYYQEAGKLGFLTKCNSLLMCLPSSWCVVSIEMLHLRKKKAA